MRDSAVDKITCWLLAAKIGSFLEVATLCGVWWGTACAMCGFPLHHDFAFTSRVVLQRSAFWFAGFSGRNSCKPVRPKRGDWLVDASSKPSDCCRGGKHAVIFVRNTSRKFMHHWSTSDLRV